MIALNSECSAVGGCDAGSPQETWLRADLAANAGRCTLAYWHHPLFASGRDTSSVRPFWDALYAGGADLVLNGHSHNYEHFAPQTPSGSADPDGLREFVVGTGRRLLPHPRVAAAQHGRPAGRHLRRPEAVALRLAVRMAVRPGRRQHAGPTPARRTATTPRRRRRRPRPPRPA